MEKEKTKAETLSPLEEAELNKLLCHPNIINIHIITFIRFNTTIFYNYSTIQSEKKL